MFFQYKNVTQIILAQPTGIQLSMKLLLINYISSVFLNVVTGVKITLKKFILNYRNVNIFY